MDSPKKKHFLKPPQPSFSSKRNFSLFFLLFMFFYFFFFHNHFSQTFQPAALTIHQLSLLPTHSSRSELPFPVKIEDRVSFPDHVLLLISKKENYLLNSYECVYHSSTGNELALPRLSVDEYTDLEEILRCPTPPANYSSMVNLRKNGVLEEDNGLYLTHRSVHSWESLVYGAVLDGNTAAVFVKGLNLRADRASDASYFSCHFGWGNSEKMTTYVLTTKAVTAAQEVIRCQLPRSLWKFPSKAHGVRITLGLPSRGGAVHRLPSVAKLIDLKSKLRNREKYELCVCTMVWNQASTLREWITYHSWLGVERWFIYDNNSDDDTKEVIDELDQENFNVSRHVWPWIKSQEAGFSHCALQAKRECKWVGFIDVDEYFYFPVIHRRPSDISVDPGRNSLRSVVAKFSDSTIGELRTTCHSFGPSGLSKIPPRGVTVGYTCRLQRPERHKSIIRPDALDDTLLTVVHHFHLRPGYRSKNLPERTAVINHYKYQVWESFRAKFYRRVATYVVDWHENQNEGSRDRAPGLGTEAIEPSNWSRQFCEVWDTGLRDFIVANLADQDSGVLPWERSLT